MGNVFIRPDARRSTIPVLFCLAALTFFSLMLRSHHPVTPDRVAGFELQLAPRKNAKAPRSIFVGRSTECPWR
jgi:hypothetical protein